MVSVLWSILESSWWPQYQAHEFVAIILLLFILALALSPVALGLAELL